MYIYSSLNDFVFILYCIRTFATCPYKSVFLSVLYKVMSPKLGRRLSWGSKFSPKLELLAPMFQLTIEFSHDTFNQNT